MRQFLFILVTFSLFLVSPQIHAVGLISKVPRILKVVPVERSQKILRVLKSRERQLLEFKASSSTLLPKQLMYARVGVNRMAHEKLVNQLKTHQVFAQRVSWNSDVLKSLASSEEQQARCRGCTRNCPNGVPCSEPTPSMKIEKILSIIPEDETELREELTKILNDYEGEMGGLSTMNNELIQMKAEIGLDYELSERVESLLRGLVSGENESWKEEVRRILDEDKGEESKSANS